ncbi:HPr family phosphocarrier protein [Pradoshia sp. D12]|uniref:HPr family phosphocarrier protein n=1 Tax=Bacillaceae TaxID=186817 RepID=UPI00112E18FE|nr:MULTISPECIES: HPr family phosphocarrier protein [Bacillaceae]QFK72806.1 HPr family phosphocarrier protein [Pradoshia sp. D12]TPF71800.1 HPr family phosphocarrier protein [Bacillus sp. D12]
MIEKEVTVQLKTGLQARPAALFVQEASRFSSDIFIIDGEKKVNVKSIMGLMSMAIGTGKTVILAADGQDEEEAIEVLEAFMTKE